MIRKLSIGLCVLIAIITICFFWQEDIYFSKPINHEKFNSYFASIGAIGTAFSLFMIYQQVTLQAEANRKSFSPNICLKRRYVFHLSTFDGSVESLGNKRPKLIRELNRQDQQNRMLKLRNYGKGVAHDVHVQPFKSMGEFSEADIGFQHIISEHMTLGVNEIEEGKEYLHDWSIFIEYLLLLNPPKIEESKDTTFILRTTPRLYMEYTDAYNTVHQKVFKVIIFGLTHGPDITLEVFVEEEPPQPGNII